MEEKNNQNNPAGSGTNDVINDIIIEEEMDDAAETIKKFREKLKTCEAEKSEYLTGWQRTKADSINARKEEEERRQDIIKFSEKTLVLELVNLADSFDRLYADKEGWEKIEKSWRQGMEHLRAQLMSIMKSRGVEAIENLGKIFNPKESESIGELGVDKEEKDGMVIEEMRKGYKMHGVIIRPSLVKVGKFLK